MKLDGDKLLADLDMELLRLDRDRKEADYGQVHFPDIAARIEVLSKLRQSIILSKYTIKD